MFMASLRLKFCVYYRLSQARYTPRSSQKIWKMCVTQVSFHVYTVTSCVWNLNAFLKDPLGRTKKFHTHALRRIRIKPVLVESNGFLLMVYNNWVYGLLESYGILNNYKIQRSGSEFPSNATLVWIFHLVTATCFGLMTIFRPDLEHATGCKQPL
jgi:hypothetical protein